MAKRNEFSDSPVWRKANSPRPRRVKAPYNMLRTAHHRVLLRIFGAWYKSPNNNCLLSYNDCPQRTGFEGTAASVRKRRLIGALALLRVVDHRLPKKTISGCLKNVGQRGPRGKENIYTNCVAENCRVFVIPRDWSVTPLDTRAWYDGK